MNGYRFTAPSRGSWLQRAYDIGARERAARPTMKGMAFGTYRSGRELNRDIRSTRTLPGIQRERSVLLSNLMQMNALSRARRLYAGGGPYGGGSRYGY